MDEDGEIQISDQVHEDSKQWHQKEERRVLISIFECSGIVDSEIVSNLSPAAKLAAIPLAN